MLQASVNSKDHLEVAHDGLLSFDEFLFREVGEDVFEITVLVWHEYQASPRLGVKEG